MKALFYTTHTVDCGNHVRAWDSAFPKAIQIIYDHGKMRHDWKFLEAVQKEKPDIVFWIGANEAPGNPKPGTFQEVRKIAPLINICSDAGDLPWHKTLGIYRHRQCFDLQVSIDGALNAPVDFSTLTPIDPRPFDGESVRDIKCGFSGTVGRWNPRSEIVLALSWFGGLTVRDRVKIDGYDNHVGFLKRCRMLLNISNTGSGFAHHIKGRVVEAGWAKCALLESEGSPIGEWFPSDCYIAYRSPKEAAEIIHDISDQEIVNKSSRLSQEVRTRFRPEIIYGEMLKRVGLAQSRPAA